MDKQQSRPGDLPPQVTELLNQIRASYKNSFRLHWTGSKIPRGALIDGDPIVWTQHGVVACANSQPGYYARTEEWSGANHDEHEMLITTDGVITTPADRPDMTVEQLRFDLPMQIL